MLDVHAPEHTPHTWRDFFIHIATIVVGLLIAVGLEQSVEWLHHRNEVRETRRTLAVERKLNLNNASTRVEEFRLITPILQRDLAVFTYLRDHPGAPPDQWPGKLSWSRYSIAYDDYTWQIAQKTNVVAYMPQNEVANLAELYGRMKGADTAEGDFIGAVAEATVYAVGEPDPSRLSPAEIQKQITLVTRAIHLQAAYGNAMANLTDHYPDFAAPTRAEVAALRRLANPQSDVDAARQVAVEHDRIKAEILRANNE